MVVHNPPTSTGHRRISEPSTVFAESTRDFLKFTMNPRDPRSYLWRKPPCKNGNPESFLKIGLDLQGEKKQRILFTCFPLLVESFFVCLFVSCLKPRRNTASKKSLISHIGKDTMNMTKSQWDRTVEVDGIALAFSVGCWFSIYTPSKNLLEPENGHLEEISELGTLAFSGSSK